MKTITCFDCDEQFTGETHADVQLAMLPHYKSAHLEVIDNIDESGKKKWMEEFVKRWDATGEE